MNSLSRASLKETNFKGMPESYKQMEVISKAYSKMIKESKELKFGQTVPDMKENGKMTSFMVEVSTKSIPDKNTPELSKVNLIMANMLKVNDYYFERMNCINFDFPVIMIIL